MPARLITVYRGHRIYREPEGFCYGDVGFFPTLAACIEAIERADYRAAAA